MKFCIEEAENGFIVEEDPELFIDGRKMPGKKHVFADLESMQDFVKDHYTKNRGRKKKEKDKETP